MAEKSQVHDAEPGRSSRSESGRYPAQLADSPLRLVLGVLMGFTLFVLVVPLVAQLVLMIGYPFFGQPMEEYRADAAAYRNPMGPVSTHLALASLIPISVALVKFLHGGDARQLISHTGRVRWAVFGLGLITALVVFNAALWVPGLGGPPMVSAPQAGWVSFALLLLITSPLQAIAEEVFFRGYLLQALASAARSPWAGIVVSALIFALLHGAQNPWLFAHRFSFGIIAGWLVCRTRGIEAAAAVHVVNNLLVYAYAMVGDGIASLRTITAIDPVTAVVNIGAFALCAGVVVLVRTRFVEDRG